jgi:hypothetical protein
MHDASGLVAAKIMSSLQLLDLTLLKQLVLQARQMVIVVAGDNGK